MTQSTIQLLVAGTIFFILGLCVLRFKRSKIAGLIPLTIGLLVILLTTIGPLSKSKKEIDRILNVNKREIFKIIVKPTGYKGYEDISLTKHTIEITDKTTIDSLCSSLTNARTINMIIKNPSWVCLVRLIKTDNNYIEFQVVNSGSSTIINVKSNGDYGWAYGTIDAALFGQLLTNAVK